MLHTHNYTLLDLVNAHYSTTIDGCLPASLKQQELNNERKKDWEKCLVIILLPKHITIIKSAIWSTVELVEMMLLLSVTFVVAVQRYCTTTWHYVKVWLPYHNQNDMITMCNYDEFQYMVFIVSWCNSFQFKSIPHISFFKTLFFFSFCFLLGVKTVFRRIFANFGGQMENEHSFCFPL